MSKEKESLKLIKNIFKDISKKTKWDMKKPMLYGYFFLHKEPALLETVKNSLVQKGYKFVGIDIVEKQDKSVPEIWRMHVEKQEIHTPETLNDRKSELTQLAFELGIDCFDGWDVGPIPK